jgi:hypothetical protein
MIDRQLLLKITIDNVEQYAMRCQKRYIPHWRKIRAKLFRDLVELQIKEFNHN